jgi:UDP-N-acetyl-D-mannosaminuronic acid dehydrogenase
MKQSHSCSESPFESVLAKLVFFEPVRKIYLISLSKNSILDILGKIMKLFDRRVCVLGLGYIGLPTACILAAAGYRVFGVDIDDKIISRVQSASVTSPEPDLQDLLTKAIQSGHLTASREVIPSDIYLIAVPTPLGPGNQPDISHVVDALESITPHLQKDALILIESTCPIGSTDSFAKKLKESCPGVHIAYCPERVLPGNILYELRYNDRVVGGVDESSTEKAASFYQTFITGQVLCTHAKTAEAIKLAENAYRDVNIAFANELSMVADSLGIDTYELIHLANKHPRVQILNPGPGVGGHCLAVDPWFLVSSAPSLATLTASARGVNQQKTSWVIDKVREAIKKQGAKKVACLGLTYKPDVSDVRGSPALVIIEALEKECHVLRVDPHVPNTEPVDAALAEAEIVVGLVAHQSFFLIAPNQLSGKTILDFAGVFR